MIKRKYTLFTLTLTSVILITVIAFYLFSIDKVSEIYIDETREAILQTKKDFLKDSVNRLISEIDYQRKAKTKQTEKLIADTDQIINLKTSLNDEEFGKFFINFFKEDPEYDSWFVLLWDNTKSRPIYDPHSQARASWQETMRAIESELSSYKVISHGEETAVFGVPKGYTDKLVKLEIADVIRSSNYEEGSYLWVNEIRSYKGGKNYAVRRVHPNMPETEGMYLSTDMTDLKGNTPYLTELQGINKDGELFFTYYFKEMNSDKISKKLTYAKLYKDYNWVICRGIYLDDIQSYVDQTNKDSKALASRLTLLLAGLFIVILAIGYATIMIIEKLYSRYNRKLLESEINQDSLTKAGSRRSGVNDLIMAFKEFKRSGTNPGIMMFDVDRFKGINDAYGHGAGDLVLIEITETILRAIRSSDRLIRWGGDEFIIIFYGLHEKNAQAYSERMLEVVSSLKISAEDAVIKPTVSIGFSYFKESDTDYAEVIKRADQALYLSKTNGRNQANIIL